VVEGVDKGVVGKSDSLIVVSSYIEKTQGLKTFPHLKCVNKKEVLIGTSFLGGRISYQEVFED